MRFLTAPPEVTSALIHTGPGARSLAEAAGAWRQLAAGLDEYADDYAAALSSLVQTWRGRSAVAMLAAAEPYLDWLRATAQQCRRAAASAQLAAAAFEATRAAVAPTAAVRANRVRQAQLLATDRFGGNAPAIAENESQYLDMWAGNTAAMTQYRQASAQATALPEFRAPTPATTPTASAGQAAARSAATVAAAAPAADLPSADAPTLPTDFDPNYGWSGLANTYANQFVSSGFPINLLSYLAQATSAQALQNVNNAIGQGLSEGEAALSPMLPLGGLGALGAAGLSEFPAAAIGTAMKVGPLSAPPAIAGFLAQAQPQVQLASSATPLPAGESTAFSGIPPIMPPVMAKANAAGSGWRKRKQQKYEDLEVGLQFKGPVMPKPPYAG
ncbi:PPE family protein [Mycolicibacter minnesotensis]